MLVGGGNRSGKTEVGVAKAIAYCTGTHPTLSDKRRPPVFGRYCATTREDGVRIILKKFQSMVRRQDLYGGSWDTAWSPSHQRLTFNLDGDLNRPGSQIHFKTYQQSIFTYGGDDLDFVIMDEHAPKSYYIENMARLVDRNGWLALTMTPEAGATWEDEEIIQRAKNDPEFACYFFDSRKNPNLSKEGLADLIRAIGKDKALFQAKIMGLFVALQGRVYPMFDENGNVIDDFELPQKGHRQLLLDSHLGKPHALAWLYWAKSGNVYLYRIGQFDSGQGGIPSLVRYIRATNAGDPIQDFIMDESMGGDPTSTKRNQFGQESIIKQLNDAGLPFLGTNQESDKSVRPGILKVREFLRPNPNTGIPRFRIFRSCQAAIRQFMIYQFKKKTAIDEESWREHLRNIEDEYVSLVRYGIMAEPMWNAPAETVMLYDGETGQPIYPSSDIAYRNVDRDPFEFGDLN